MRRHLTALCLVASFVSADQVSAADALVEYARARETMAKTVDIVFSVTEHYTRGSMSDGSRRGAVVPASDATLQSTNRFILSGHSVRYEHSHPIWHVETGGRMNKPFISVSNDTFSKVFYPNGIGGAEFPAGVIGKGAECLDIKYYLLAPLTMHFRGTMPDIAPYPLTNAKDTGRISVVDMVSCKEYDAPFSADKAVHFWVDPEQSYVIRRFSMVWRGHTIDQTDVRYSRIEAGVPVPTEWKRTKFGQDGKVLVTTEVRVDDSTINTPQASKQFDVVFPYGCSVYDQRNAMSYRVDHSGDLRLLSSTGEEQNVNVPQPGASWVQRNRWLAAVGAVPVVLLSALWLWRKRRPTGMSPGILA